MRYYLTVYNNKSGYFADIGLNKPEYLHSLHESTCAWMYKNKYAISYIEDFHMVQELLRKSKEEKQPIEDLQKTLIEYGFIEHSDYTFYHARMNAEIKPNKYLQKYGLSMHALEQLSGVSSRTLANWFSGDKRQVFETVLTGCLAIYKGYTNDFLYDYHMGELEVK